MPVDLGIAFRLSLETVLVLTSSQAVRSGIGPTKRALEDPDRRAGQLWHFIPVEAAGAAGDDGDTSRKGTNGTAESGAIPVLPGLLVQPMDS